MKKVFRVALFIFGIIGALALLLRIVFGDFQIREVLIVVGLFVFSILLREPKKTTDQDIPGKQDQNSSSPQ